MLENLFNVVKEDFTKGFGAPWDTLRPRDPTQNIFDIERSIENPRNPSKDTKPRQGLSSGTKNAIFKLHVNILQSGTRVAPRIDLSADSCPDLRTVFQNTLQHYKRGEPGTWKVRLLLPKGLMLVSSDKEWTEALQVARCTEWFDSELKIIIIIEM